MQLEADTEMLPEIQVLQQTRLPIWDEELWMNKHRVIYGPVASRRLGESLGINFFPKAKICSFNCCYCDVGVTSPSALQEEFLRGNILSQEIIKEEIEKGIRYHLEVGTHIDHITICGNGEATDYPYFLHIAHFLLDLKTRLFPEIPIAIITNSANVHKKEVVDVINEFDVNFFKLDAGDESTFNAIDRPLAGTISFFEIIEGLKNLDNLNIQTAIVDSSQISNIPSLKGSFITLLKDLEPMALYIHNIDYPTPDKNIRRLELKEMIELGQFIAKRSEIPVKVLHSLVSLRRQPQ